MKTIEFYTYSSPCITILWNGHTQPLGFFKSAIEARDEIKQLESTPGNFWRWTIKTPEGIIPFEI